MTIEDFNKMRSQIPGCFGSADKIFAGHPNDENHAKELRKFCNENAIDPDLVVAAAAGYLYRTGIKPAERIIEEIKKVEKFFQN